MRNIVDRLRDEPCEDDIEDAAQLLELLLHNFQMHSPKMDGSHSWRFRNGAWPMTHAKGPTIEVALSNVLEEIERERNAD